MAVGVALAALGAHLGLGWFVPPPLSYHPTLHLPTPQPHLWRHLLSPEILLQTVSLTLPRTLTLSLTLSLTLTLTLSLTLTLPLPQPYPYPYPYPYH